VVTVRRRGPDAPTRVHKAQPMPYGNLVTSCGIVLRPADEPGRFENAAGSSTVIWFLAESFGPVCNRCFRDAPRCLR